MTQIKICGLSRMEDINAVNLYKPDYVGFVFSQSKRQVTLAAAKNLINKLDKSIKTVGVFVNETEENVAYIADYCRINVIQLHGDETAEYINGLKKLTSCEIWKAIRVINKEELKKLGEYPVERNLLDTYSKDNYGGSGHRFNWEFLRGIDKSNIILAGGLSAGNVLEAVKTVCPYMLDISSGAESNGYKDINKIKEIIELVRGI